MEQQLTTMKTAHRYIGFILMPYIILLLVYLPALIDLVSDWANDPNYSHGFLIPVVSAILIWNKRKTIASLPSYLDNRGLVLIIIGMILFILANGAAEYFTLRFSFVLVLFGLTYYLFGKDIIKTTWFAFFMLLFMIPIPYVVYYALTFPMQTLASKITVVTLNTIGMSAVRQGNIIHITGHSLEVAEACSGIRSLVSLLALGAIYAYLTQKRFIGQLIVFLATIPIAVIGNVVRGLVTSVLVATVSEKVTEEPAHSIMGMLVFVVALVLLVIVGAIVKRIFK